MSVQRYGFWCIVDKGGMNKDDTGSYVKYSDYAEIKQQLERLVVAGDNMAESFGSEYPTDPRIKEWNNAKIS